MAPRILCDAKAVKLWKTRIESALENKEISKARATRLLSLTPQISSYLEGISKELRTRAMVILKTTGTGYTEALKLASQQLVEEEGIVIERLKRQEKLQLIANKNISAIMKSEKWDYKGVSKILVGSESYNDTCGLGAEQIQESVQRYLFSGPNGWVRKLEQHKEGNLLQILTDPKNEADIADTYLSLLDKDSKINVSQETKNKFGSVAKILMEKNELERREQNARGANIQFNSNRIARTRWDSIKIYKMGLKEFISFESPLIDWERSFPDVVSTADRTKLLEKHWKMIVSKVKPNTDDYSFEESTRALPTAKGIGGMFYKRASRKREFYFKDGASLIKHLNTIGGESLSEAIINDTISASRNIALLQKLGPYAYDTFKKLITEVQTHNPMTSQIKISYLNNLFTELAGSTSPNASYTLAKIGKNIRSVNNMLHLGALTVRSLPDLANLFATARYNGMNFFESLQTTLDSFISFFESEKDRMDFMYSAGSAVQNILGTKIRYDVLNASRGFISNTERLFFRLNFSQKWDRSIKSGMTAGMSSFYFRQKDLLLKELSERVQSSFEHYEITDKEWDVLRSSPVTFKNGKSMILPDSAYEANEDLIKNIYQLDESASKEKVDVIRKDIYTKFMAFLSEQERHAILDSGAKERAILHWGTSAGTVQGELLRFLTQYKSYSLSFYNRIVQRQLSYGLLNKNGLMANMEFVASVASLNFASYYLDQILKGRKPNLTNIHTIENIILPAAGIFGDMTTSLLDSSRGSEFTNYLIGPTGSNVNDVAKLMGSIATFNKPGTAMVKFAEHHIPFANIFYINAFLKYALFNTISDWISPGSVHRTNAYLEHTYGLKTWL